MSGSSVIGMNWSTKNGKKVRIEFFWMRQLGRKLSISHFRINTYCVILLKLLRASFSSFSRCAVPCARRLCCCLIFIANVNVERAKYARDNEQRCDGERSKNNYQKKIMGNEIVIIIYECVCWRCSRGRVCAFAAAPFIFICTISLCLSFLSLFWNAIFSPVSFLGFTSLLLVMFPGKMRNGELSFFSPSSSWLFIFLLFFVSRHRRVAIVEKCRREEEAGASQVAKAESETLTRWQCERTEREWNQIQ